MNSRAMSDIEAEVDRIRQNIWARIKDMTSEEKEAYYQAQADEARREFNIKVSSLRPVRPIGMPYRRAHQAAASA